MIKSVKTIITTNKIPLSPELLKIVFTCFPVPEALNGEKGVAGQFEVVKPCQEPENQSEETV